MIKWLKYEWLELVVNVLRHESFCSITKTQTEQVIYKMYYVTQCLTSQLSSHVFVNTIYIYISHYATTFRSTSNSKKNKIK